MYGVCCADVFLTAETLQTHIQVNHVHRCEYCGQYNLNMRAHQEHQCVFKSFTEIFFDDASNDFLANLKRDEQRRIHVGFPCICGVSKVSLYEFLLHRSHGYDECAPVVCRECDRTLTGFFQLGQHLDCIDPPTEGDRNSVVQVQLVNTQDWRLYSASKELNGFIIARLSQNYVPVSAVEPPDIRVIH